MAMIKCPSCGTDNMAGSYQCIKCGAKMAAGAAPGAPAPAAPAPITPANDPHRFSLTRDDVAPTPPSSVTPSGPGVSAAVAAVAAVTEVGGIPVVTPAASASSVPVINPVSEPVFGSPPIASTPSAPSSYPILNAPGGALYGSSSNAGAAASPADAQAFANKIAGYEYASGLIWLIFGIIQVICCVTAIAGAWNIYAATNRFKLAKAIRALNPGVPAAFQDIGGLMVMGAVNLILGGVIGVIFVGFDAYIRSLVLKNAHLFR